MTLCFIHKEDQNIEVEADHRQSLLIHLLTIHMFQDRTKGITELVKLYQIGNIAFNSAEPEDTRWRKSLRTDFVIAVLD